MRRTLLLPLLALPLACGGPDVAPGTPLSELTYQEQGVPFVDAGDLRAWMEAGHAEEVVFVDNRNGFAFQQQRIADARLIPTDQIRESLGKLPVNKWAVFYCTWPDDGLSVRAARIAQENGYESVAVLKGGLYAWRDAGYPVASGS